MCSCCLLFQVNENGEFIGEQHRVDVQGATEISTDLTNLEPDSSYQVEVKAYTRKGDGEMSRPRVIKTKGAGK